MGLHPAVREFLDTKPDSGDPDESVAVRRAAIRKRSDALFGSFAARLGEAGVAVSHHRYPGAVHGSLALTGTWPPAQLWHDDVVKVLREAHAR